MFRKILFTVCMLIITGICIYSIMLVDESDEYYDVSLDESDIKYKVPEDDLYTVTIGNVAQKIVIAGEIMPVHADEVLEVFIEGKVDEIKTHVSVGEVIGPDNVYAEYKKQLYKTSSVSCCIAIEKKDNGMVIRFLDYSKLYLGVNIPEKYINNDMKNKKIKVNYNGNDFEGVITFVDNYSVDGKVFAQIQYANQEFLLRPGSTCIAEIIIAEKEEVVTVPVEFVIYNEISNEYSIMKYSDEMPYIQNVDVGLVGNDYVEIQYGLCEGDVIVYPKDEMSLRHYLQSIVY